MSAKSLLKAGVVILLGTTLVVLTSAPGENTPSPVAKLQDD